MPDRSSAAARLMVFLRLTPVSAAAVAFTLCYLAGAGIAAAAMGNGEFVFYIAVMVVLMVAVGAVHLRVGFSAGVLWGLSVWGLAHMCGGLVPVGSGDARTVLYNLWLVPGWLKYDQLVHAYGFGVAAWACWEGLRGRLALLGDARPTAGMALVCALAAMGLGAVNEIVEFTATRVMHKTNVGDYENNALDLVFNGIGAGVAAAVIWARGRGATGPAPR